MRAHRKIFAHSEASNPPAAKRQAKTMIAMPVKLVTALLSI
jgi:hypothetical protein